MMMSSTDAGYRLIDRSLDRFNAFTEGTGMLLRAMVDEFDTPVSAAETGRSAALPASKTIAIESDFSPLRAYLEAAAARFEDPRLSTVICIKPLGRSAFAA